jgi:polyhydroxyalkanoate synthesis regulator phasin
MIDSIKKVMLAGVGAAVITAEKVEEALSDWVEKGKVSAEEAKEMADRVASRGKEEFESTSRDVKKAVQELLEKAGVGQKDRIDALERRLLALEVEVANLNTHLRNENPR